MVYKVIGLMSGSSLDGLDIVFAELLEERGQWQFEITKADCYEYDESWNKKLQQATELNARDYLLLHAAYGHYLGAQVNRFIDQHQLHYKVGLIGSHGHTTFHLPAQKMTAQLGDGAAIAAVTKLPVVSDLRALDVAFGGQGAPIVPIGEKLLFPEFNMFLNLGGIANISFNTTDRYVAFDICAANRVLNLLAQKKGKAYDDGGQWASAGSINNDLLEQLNALSYYQLPYPKSLANSFGTDEVFPMIEAANLSVEDALRTYVEHIVVQIKASIKNSDWQAGSSKMMATGGGAFNRFLMERLKVELHELAIEVVVPDEKIVQYKEALIMGLIAVLRWRQEYNVLSSVTGAERESIGGAVWIGQEA